MTDPGTERLNKRMARLGLCSRREADEWITRGWVRINGRLARLGEAAGERDRIDVDPSAHGRQQAQVTILLNKPIGYVSAQAEDGHRPALVLVDEDGHWPSDPVLRRFSAAHRRGLAPAGRLDIDSTGLLVLTQDGRVARQLIGADKRVTKEYLVRVELGGSGQDVRSRFAAAQLQQLRHGLTLDGVALRPAEVQWQNAEQLRFVLTEGRKRQVRRMCEQVGLTVTGLKRVRIGKVLLGRLPLGQWRYLGPEEKF